MNRFFLLILIAPLIFSSCNKKTSPVDLNSSVADSSLKPLYVDYDIVDSFDIVNYGKYIDVKIIDNCILVIPDKNNYLGTEVFLKDILIKSPSEHTINGEHFPLEMQFIHIDSMGQLVTASVFVKEGKENTYFNPIINNLPQKDKKILVKENLDVYSLFPAAPGYWFYEGTTTIAPEEKTKWFIMKKPIEASETQIKKIIDKIGYNEIPTVKSSNKVYEF